jgi:PAS domain-containing protein
LRRILLQLRGVLRQNQCYPAQEDSLQHLTLQDMTAETHNAKQSSESLDLRNLIETMPALVVCAQPDGFAEFANHACQEYVGFWSALAALHDIHRGE